MDAAGYHVYHHGKLLIECPHRLAFDMFHRLDWNTGWGTAEVTDLSPETARSWVVTTCESCTGSVNWMDAEKNILFHFNPRPHQKKIMMNSRNSGGWGKEESIWLPKDEGDKPIVGVLIQFICAVAYVFMV